MARTLITLVFATSVSAMTVWAAACPTTGRSAERESLLVEIASPPPPTFAISIL